MSTMTARPPKGFAATPFRFTPSNSLRTASRRLPGELKGTNCRRTRSDLLQMLVGPDSGQFPRFPSRRFFR